MIRNGTIVTPWEVKKLDVRIEAGIISEMAHHLFQRQGEKVIDASNCYVLAGGIDVHTHLAFPGTVDDFESGTKAAAAGGITTIINFTHPKEGQSLLENVQEWKQKAKSSCIDYNFHPIINECNERVLEELPILCEQEGITSIKLFMAYKDSLMVDDSQMYRLMKQAGQLGMITNVHAENGDVIEERIKEALALGNTAPIFHALTRPASLEAEATSRALRIAEAADATVYIVHVTCAGALEEIERARRRGVRVFAETCPHYLVFEQQVLKEPFETSGKYVCSPPLRHAQDRESLWQGIASGLISVVASDHSSIPFEGGKTKGCMDFNKIPNGCPGVEDLFSIVYQYGVTTGRISLQKLTEVISLRPAQIFGLYPKKGVIAVGSDADLILLNRNQTRRIQAQNQVQRVDYNLYEGTEVNGSITCVISRGEVIAENGLVVGRAGRGHFIRRKRPVDTLTLRK